MSQFDGVALSQRAEYILRPYAITKHPFPFDKTPLTTRYIYIKKYVVACVKEKDRTIRVD